MEAFSIGVREDQVKIGVIVGAELGPELGLASAMRFELRQRLPGSLASMPIAHGDILDADPDPTGIGLPVVSRQREGLLQS